MLHDDLIENCRITHPGSARSLEKAAVFYTDFEFLDDQNLINSAYEFFKEHVLPLPFSRNLFIIRNAFSGGETMIAFVGNDQNSLKDIPDYQGKKARLSIVLIIHSKQTKQFYVIARAGIFDIYGPENTPLALCAKMQGIDENQDEVMKQTVRDVLSFCMILNTKYFEKKETIVPYKLNVARKKRGKIALRNYITVSLRKDIVSENGEICGNHKTPIPHWRRGHIRKYKDGKIITVRPTIVNFNGATPIKKQYKTGIQ